MIVYDDVEPSEKIRLYDKNITISKQQVTPFSPLYRSGDIVIPHIKQQEALFNELSHFIFCIKRSATPLTSGTDGLKVIAMLEATDLAIKKGSEIQLNLG